MKAIVLGAGGMGSALAWDLSRSKGVESVTIADRDRKRVQAAAKAAAKDGTARVRAVTADLASEKNVRRILKGQDVAVGAADYALNLSLARAAIAERVHACDLGG